MSTVCRSVKASPVVHGWQAATLHPAKFKSQVASVCAFHLRPQEHEVLTTSDGTNSHNNAVCLSRTSGLFKWTKSNKWMLLYSIFGANLLLTAGSGTHSEHWKDQPQYGLHNCPFYFWKLHLILTVNIWGKTHWYFQFGGKESFLS